MGASFFVAFAVTRNFANVEEVLQSPPEPAASVIHAITPGNARIILQHLANEELRSYLENWEVAQIGLDLILAGLLFLEPSTRKLALVPAAMCLLVAFQHFRVTPEIIWSGRQVAFGLSTEDLAARKRLNVMQRIYEFIEISKFCMATIVGIFLITRGAARRHRHRPPEWDSSSEHAART